jgi:hypothetical protein
MFLCLLSLSGHFKQTNALREVYRGAVDAMTLLSVEHDCQIITRHIGAE